MDNYEFEKNDIVNYIIWKYQNDFNNQISPIKLQKSLYFLYVWWIEKVYQDKLKNELEDSEVDDYFYSQIDMSKCKEYLFQSNFEAWQYGPVDPKIYRTYKYGDDMDNELTPSNLDVSNKENGQVIINFIDNALDKIFNTNDFTLVDLSHEDDCWNKAYRNDKNHTMYEEDIKNEYESRA